MKCGKVSTWHFRPEARKIQAVKISRHRTIPQISSGGIDAATSRFRPSAAYRQGPIQRFGAVLPARKSPKRLTLLGKLFTSAV